MADETKLIQGHGVEPVTPTVLPTPVRHKISGGKGLVRKQPESLDKPKKKRELELLKQETKATHGNVLKTHPSKHR